MVPSLKKKWHSMCEDARVTLEVAFRDGITRPIIVPMHFSYTRNVLGYDVEFHHFRVGYAVFVVALIENFPPILWDVDLVDGFPIYPV